MSKNLQLLSALPTIYIGTPDGKMPHFKPEPIESELYAKVNANMVQVWVDTLCIHRTHRTLVLANRCIKPMPNLPWVQGGRLLPGETIPQGWIRHFRADTSKMLTLTEDRYIGFFGPDIYIWPERQQEPQNVPVHGLVFTGVVELSKEEIRVMNANLNPKEYHDESVDEYDMDRLEQFGAHQAMKDFYVGVFGR